MHGMLSAAIVIGVFAVCAAACLYLAVRVFAAGGRRVPDHRVVPVRAGDQLQS